MGAYLDYARRGKNSWWRCLLAIALAMVLWFVVSTGLGVALTLTHLLPQNMAQQLTTPTHPVVFFIGNGVFFALIVAAFAAAAWLIQRKTPADLAGAWRWNRVLAGAAIWTACLTALTLIDLALRPHSFRWSATSETGPLAIAALLGLGVQTFAEEYVFRGYLTQQLLLALKRPLPAALVSGTLFGAMHIPNGWPQCASAVLFGVVWALLAIRTGGIAFTWGMHLVNNLFGAALVVSARDVFHGAPGLITQDTPDLMWSDVILGFLLLAAPIWLAWRLGRAESSAAAEAP